MTNNPGTGAPAAETARQFPNFPPRNDMQNPIHLHDPGYQAALRRHFGTPHTTIVLGEVPVGRNLGQRQGLRVPDLLIAFNVDRASVIEQRGYSIRDQGKPPDFVLEIASETTGQTGYTEKRDDYAGYEIPEYWRFDPSGGRYHGTALAGDWLVNGVYQPIPIARMDDDNFSGHSGVLNLDLRWEQGQLGWHDPVEQRHIVTFDDERARADTAEARAASSKPPASKPRPASANSKRSSAGSGNPDPPGKPGPAP